MVIAAFICVFLLCNIKLAKSCTGITLTSEDGSIVFGRTMEWSTFDLKSKLHFIPRGVNFIGQTPTAEPGYEWKNAYGFIGFGYLGQALIVEGINEKQLAAGVFYHPTTAEYAPYESKHAKKSVAPTDICNLILGTCSTVDDVRKVITEIQVAPVNEEAVGKPAPIHLIVTDKTGSQIVIEFAHGQVQVHNASALGVITNDPTYDWHVTNLRNYINLHPVAHAAKQIKLTRFDPLGGGSGMLGLPGDFTSPSRFVRAVAFTATARKQPTAEESVYEALRILDNFNVPVTAAEGEQKKASTPNKCRSGTQWTSVTDVTNGHLYYHTHHNRRVRKIDLTKIDFEGTKLPLSVELDKREKQDMEVVNFSESEKRSEL